MRLRPNLDAFLKGDVRDLVPVSVQHLDMVGKCQVDASIFREWIANVSRRSASAALAHLLCEFGVRLEAAGLGEKLRYELPMTQEQLADCTGLTAVHVNRTLKKLEASGDISRSVRHVAIADWSKISATADFRAAYLHLPEDTLLP